MDGREELMNGDLAAGQTRDGMRLIEEYFTGQNAAKRVMLFENFVNLLAG